ncbi:MAG: sensor domain-containing diguanylate cyclase [Reinekea sp.]|jgi:diguanylate cyclase (GGDEF)-like protein|nr:sensor domain-containing diguanylate cyclase [Reinekea sp.]
MKTPPIPDNEQERLIALRSLSLLDTEPEERFDRLTRMAKRMFKVPIALVSIIDEDRQWFKSSFGVDVSETPRDISFCGHAIVQPETLVIPNALADERFYDNPLVTGDPDIRFYAGTPIKTPSGHAIGTLCIIDKVARVFHPEDVEMLEDMARMVEREIAALHLATMDELTGVSNRRGFYLIAEHSLSLCLRHKSKASIAMFDLNKFKQINDEYGHAEGDRVLSLFATELKRFFRESDLVGRLGGDEFAVLLLETSPPAVLEVLEKLNDSVVKLNKKLDRQYQIGYAVGMATFDPQHPKTIHQLVEEADKSMYREKAQTEPR